MILPRFDLIAAREDGAELMLHLEADHPAFAGHFPDLPVLAGVIQIDWALRLAGLHCALRQSVAQDFQVKFSRMLHPGHSAALRLDLDRARGRLSFDYRLGTEVASAGRIRLVS